ncbi:hypothetical protein D3C83_209970 [compost metagenome]
MLFGDGPWDVASAREAGIDFIGINQTERGRGRLHAAGATHVFGDFTEVAAILRLLSE